MLCEIPKCISPELMMTMMEMGHGDEIVFADGDFPAKSLGKRVIRADGVMMQEMLDSILQLFPIDSSCMPIAVMAPWEQAADPPIHSVMKSAFKKHCSSFENYEYLERYAFYSRAKDAFAIVVTSEADGNFILRKGVVNG
jgi:L-fucose mutarotase